MSDPDSLAAKARLALQELLAAEGGYSIEAAHAALVAGRKRQLPAHLQSAANKRTRDYKARQALELTPESEDVVTACGYAVLGILEAEPNRSAPLMRRLLDELVRAGFDEEASRDVVLRLTMRVEDRRTSWHRRILNRTVRRLLLAQEETSDQHTG
jgi:hypothetical protein